MSMCIVARYEFTMVASCIVLHSVQGSPQPSIKFKNMMHLRHSVLRHVTSEVCRL